MAEQVKTEWELANSDKDVTVETVTEGSYVEVQCELCVNTHVGSHARR